MSRRITIGILFDRELTGVQARHAAETFAEQLLPIFQGKASSDREVWGYGMARVASVEAMVEV